MLVRPYQMFTFNRCFNRSTSQSGHCRLYSREHANMHALQTAKPDTPLLQPVGTQSGSCHWPMMACIVQSCLLVGSITGIVDQSAVILPTSRLDACHDGRQ
jgi:hypothetical protein